LFERYICTLRKAGSIAANERSAFDAGGRVQIFWRAEQTLVARASCEKDRADTDAGGLATADRRLDFTPNPALSLRVWLRSNRDSTIGLVTEGLPRLLPGRGETIGQAIEIVAIVQVFRSGLSCGPNVAGLALELLSLRGRHQPEIGHCHINRFYCSLLASALDPDWRCHTNQIWPARRLEVPTQVQAEVAARHVWKASSRKTRSVRRDLRWSWTLKVFWTAA
jgi:hypothetical protein